VPRKMRGRKRLAYKHFTIVWAQSVLAGYLTDVANRDFRTFALPGPYNPVSNQFDLDR
jgi:hypothetical protein